MKINREALLEALTNAAKIANVRAKPVLNNVVLKSTGDVLTMRATNLEIGMIQDVACDGEIDCAVNASKLRDVVRSAVGDTVALTAKNNSIEVLHDIGKARIDIADSDDFPEMKYKTKGTAKASGIASSWAKVKHSIAQDQSNYALAGVSMIKAGDVLTLATTDTFRLSVASVACSGGEDFNCIVIAQGMDYIGDNAEIVMDGNKLVAVCDDSTVAIATIEGKFPQYDKILEQDLSESFTVCKSQMIQALKSMVPNVQPETKAIEISTNGSELIIASGESFASVDCNDTITPVSVNLDYMIQAVSSAPEQQKWKCGGADKPLMYEDDSISLLLSPVCRR